MRRASWMAAAAGLVVALGVPAAASAKTVVVDAHGPDACSGTAPQCRTLTAASGVTGTGDTVEIHPGFYAESATFDRGPATIKGVGGGIALVVGRLAVTGDTNFTFSRIMVQSADDTPLAVQSAAAAPLMPTSVAVEGSTFLTAKNVPAVSITGRNLVSGTVTATVRHVTAVSSGGPAIAFGGPVAPMVTNSIALGGIDPASANGANNDTGSLGAAASLFCDSALHLVRGSSAIGAGGSLDPGEVTEDIDGEARGPAPDRGADQYSNKCDPAPQAPPQLPPTSGLPPAVAGGPSAPSIQIAKPKQGEVLKRSRHRRRGSHRRPKPRALAFTGTAADQLGLASIQLALRKTGTGATTCKWFDGRKLRKVPCAQVILLRGTLRDFAWSYMIPSSASLPKGSYLLYATAINRAGVAQTTFTQGQNVVSFKVK
jgi:hypothetical protein